MSTAVPCGIINECADISFNQPALLDAVQSCGRWEWKRENEWEQIRKNISHHKVAECVTGRQTENPPSLRENTAPCYSSPGGPANINPHVLGQIYTFSRCLHPYSLLIWICNKPCVRLGVCQHKAGIYIMYKSNCATLPYVQRTVLTHLIVIHSTMWTWPWIHLSSHKEL